MPGKNLHMLRNEKIIFRGGIKKGHFNFEVTFFNYNLSFLLNGTKPV